MTVKVEITKRGRDKEEDKKIFEHALRKFRNKTRDDCKRYNQMQYFEKPCIENERARRRQDKVRKYEKGLRKKYGNRWRDYIER